jgi:glucose-6-phosphate isomerase
MSNWPKLHLVHPSHPWSIDATTMGFTADALDPLPWNQVFREMSELEAGSIANRDEGRQVGHYWLRAPDRAPTVGLARTIEATAEAVRSFAADIRSGRETTPDGSAFTDLLQIGIGGSALGPQLIVDALGGAGLRVSFLDNTDPDGMARVLEALAPRLHRTLVLVVSKSGGTPETRNGMLFAQRALRERGLPVAAHMVAITGENSQLHQVARAEGWRKTFPMWDWVGGRTSVTSAVGLLPAELAGVDTHAFLAGARDMDDWTRESRWHENPAALLAGCWYVAGQGRGDRAMVVLPYADRLVLFSKYLQQLIMESIGKELDRDNRTVHQGLVVYGNKGSTDQHAYVQQLRDGRNDFFATFLQVLEDDDALEVDPGVTCGDYLQGFLLGTRRALTENGRPAMTITVPRVTPYTLGGLVALFERAVGFYATLVHVNAYHQPGVEAGKKAAGQILALSRACRESLARRPATAAVLARELGADTMEVWFVLEKLTATHRLVREGGKTEGTYRERRATDG